MDPWAADRRARNQRRANRFVIPRQVRVRLATGVAAVVAPFAGASPVGSPVLDWGWSAALAGLGASCATRAKRGQLLVAAAIAVLGARTPLSVALATIAVICGSLSTRRLDRRAVLARGLSGGATVVSLLAGAHEISDLHAGASVVAVAGLLGVSAWRNSPPVQRRRAAIGIGVVLVAWVGAAALAAAGIAANANRLSAGSSQLRLGLAAARLGQVDLAADHLEAARVAMAKARDNLGTVGFPARLFPGSAQQVTTVVDVLGGLERATTDARRAADIVTGDRLAITAGTVDLEALAALEIPLGRLADSLGWVVEEIDRHEDDPLLPQLRDRLDELRAQSVRGFRDAERGSQAAGTLPDALGLGGQRRYLVIFTSPAESRGRLGFPGSFAEVLMVDGRYRLGEQGSTSETFQGLAVDQATFDLGDPRLRPYVPYGATRELQAATIPPDFRVVADTVAEMWVQSGREPLDGVLRFDPSSLAPLLQFTGPVAVEGHEEPLTAANLVEYLLVDQYVEFENATAPRREVLEDVAEVTFERLEVADLPKPRELFDVFAPLVRTGHLQAVSFSEPVADLLGDIGMDGRLRDPASDGLLVTAVNGLGNKIDSFLDQDITYRGRVDDGRVDATVSVRLTNGAPPRGLPDYVIGSFTRPAPPTGTNRLSLFVSTAVPIDGATLDGNPVQVLSGRSGGWYVHQLVVEIPPQSAATVDLHVVGDLPERPYQLVLEPGGGTRPDVVTVDLTVDGTPVRHQSRTEGRQVLR